MKTIVTFQKFILQVMRFLKINQRYYTYKNKGKLVGTPNFRNIDLRFRIFGLFTVTPLNFNGVYLDFHQSVDLILFLSLEFEKDGEAHGRFV